jgi:hypothetical protein
MEQETLEEATKKYANKNGDIPTTELEDAIFKQGFIDGAKWQQQRSYSEEEVVDIAKQAFVLGKNFGLIGTFKEWFDTVKKK